MRTKTLLLSAVAMAAGLLSSFAQPSNVYSANVVGYINIPLTNGGFTLVGNQLDFDGTGTNNTILTSIGTNLPPTTKVLAWNTNSSTFSSITLGGSGAWSSGAAGPIVAHALQPGGGVFIQIPVSVTSPTNVILTGTVLQRTNALGLVSGFQIASYPFPIGGGLTTNLNYIANPSTTLHDRALTWNVGSQTFTTHIWGTTSWSAGDPQLTVGGAVFLQPYQPNTWTNAFFVQ